MMGLYLAVFDVIGRELDGVEVGSYQDFHTFRDAVVRHVDNGKAGSNCPILINHSDCDGSWPPGDSVLLIAELARIERAFRALPPTPIPDGWQRQVAAELQLVPSTLYDCFFDVDGEPLVQRIRGLAELSVQRRLPILFQ